VFLVEDYTNAMYTSSSYYVNENTAIKKENNLERKQWYNYSAPNENSESTSEVVNDNSSDGDDEDTGVEEEQEVDEYEVPDI